MPLDFPSTPSIGQTYTVGNSTWVWNGTQWTSQTTEISVGSGVVYSEGLEGATGIQTVTHNLDNEDISVTLWGATGSKKYLVLAPISIIDTDSIEIYFDENVFTGNVVIQG